MHKKHEKANVVQRLECAAPKRWLKYIYITYFIQHLNMACRFAGFMACRFLRFKVACNMPIFAAQLIDLREELHFILFLFSASYACHSTQGSLCPANRRWQVHPFEPQTVLWQFTYQVTPPKTPRRCQEVS